MLALAIYNSVHLDLRFPRLVYKKLLGCDIQINDLEEFEPQLYSTLRNINDMKENIEELCLTFCISYDYFGAEKTHELVPEGSNLTVTLENKDEFISLYLDWIATTSVERQFAPFYRGFYKVITKESIRV